MLWEIDIYPAEGQPDRLGASMAADAADLGLPENITIRAAQGYLLEGDLTPPDVELAAQLFSDPVVERAVAAPVGDSRLAAPPADDLQPMCVLRKPGVMDPVSLSAENALKDLGLEVASVRTFRKYWVGGVRPDQLAVVAAKLLSNDAIERVVPGVLDPQQIAPGSSYAFERVEVPLRNFNDEQLENLSREGQLYLTLVEMQTIQQHFRELERDPTDVELETLAQTWSEHCSHKTLAGRIAYRDENGERRFENMLKETIFTATQELRKKWGDADWCASVFEDNAGVVHFNEQWNVVFKVETHNHPSALEPYGGANTGIGGVIRDPMGTGLGAKPVANTDVFCFAPPDTPADELPAGVLHPRRVMKGVVSGVRDYGNRMGIPTVNGAVLFDRRYLGNPLVFCGNVGMLPKNKTKKRVQPNDWIVALGGRTGRDGIHGATFSSAELTSESESLSGGAVQIGNPITEKIVLDVLLEARDRGLYNSVTDCGAGGFSSAVGEMGEDIGAEVWLDRAPLKYAGLSYTEIWISEAQERMVFSVPPEMWEAFSALCASENVEATIIGAFKPTGRLRLLYNEQEVADLDMRILHDGRPPVVRDAVFEPPPVVAWRLPTGPRQNHTHDLLRILGSLNVASKEWVIRQYDHEVQGGSVIKPLVGVQNDGPSDAAVVRPLLDSQQGLVISCGINPHFGDCDPYHMAASAIDEALRNCVAVGADPSRIAILDNFCWGYTDRPETLGALVRAALACHDLALELETPFISGKDSLNNEFSYDDANGARQTLSIPSTLLISAMGQVADVSTCVTMDLKRVGDLLYQIGATKNEMGGSHFSLIHKLAGGEPPQVDAPLAKRTFAALHRAIQQGLVAACHDLSEGGLSVAAAEMAFAGELGLKIELARAAPLLVVDHEQQAAAQNAMHTALLLFSESNTRFLCEVAPEHAVEFEEIMQGIPHASIGEVVAATQLEVVGLPSTENQNTSPPLVIDAALADLKEAWQAPLRWSSARR